MLDNFDIFVLIFCVELLWELNPNRAKSLEFGGVQKAQEEKPLA
jgi:hypothetical protein